MEQIICVTSPTSTKIIVLMRKDVFIQWVSPADAGCIGGPAQRFSPEFNRAFNRSGVPQVHPNLTRVRTVTGIRG